MSLLTTRFIKLGRTLREGFRNFHRDGWLSFATVSVLTLSLYIIAVTFLLVTVGGVLIREVQGSVNISAYFYPSVKESRIMEVQKDLKAIAEIDDVVYISREQALKDFKASTKDTVILKALDEFEKEGDNPLFASLVIKATAPEYYADIATLLATPKYADDISEVNFSKNQGVIDQLAHIVHAVRTIGITLGAIFIIIAILVVYNTVRITMFARRQEFEVMRLVGASNLYVRMPSLYEGFFYGIAATIATLVLLALTTYFIAPIVRGVLFGNVSLFHFYVQYFWEIAALTLFSGMILGMISSTIAIRRYLKV